MRDYDRQGKNKITYQDFHEVGQCFIKLITYRIDQLFIFSCGNDAST